MKTSDHPSLAASISAYRDIIDIDDFPQDALIAIAAPVVQDKIKMTNAGWELSQKELSCQLAFTNAVIRNDFWAIAIAAAVPFLEDVHLLPLNNGSPLEEHSAKAVIGPGTGLGTAFLTWNPYKNGWDTHTSESAQCMMSARTEREFQIHYMLQDWLPGRQVSIEQVCSGTGLEYIFKAIRSIDKRKDLQDKTAAEISEAAISGDCNVSKEALETMVEILGRQAAHMILTMNAYGGLYIGGGIGGKIPHDFFTQHFFKGYEHLEPKYEELILNTPVFMITHPDPAFIGMHAELFSQNNTNYRLPRIEA